MSKITLDHLLAMMSSQSNNNASLTTTPSLLCDSKVLSSIGNQTLYPYETYSNLTYSNLYICPDHYSNSSFSIIFVTLETHLLAFTCLLMFYKRKHQHVTQRNIPIQLAHLSASYFFSFLTTIRYVIGRHTFPCALHLFLYFELPPLVLLNKILKCWRIFARHMIEKEKNRFYRMSTSSENTTVTSSSDMSMNVIGGSSLVELDEIVNSSKSTNELNEEMTVQQDDDIPKSIGKRIQFFKISIHPIFHLIIYGILFLAHFLLFFIVSGIDIGLNQQNNSFFLTSGVSPLDFTKGCITNANISYIAGALAFIYVVVELVTLILCFLSLKDTYFQKVETILLVIMQLITIVIFVALSAIPAYKNMAEFYFSYAYIPVIYLLLDVFIGTTLPCFYAIYEDWKISDSKLSHDTKNGSNVINGNVEKSILELVLENKMLYDKLLDYAKRSYCSESVLCYRDVEQFQKISGKNAESQQLKFAQYLMNTYLLPHSPALLNMPTVISQKVDIWKETLFGNQSVIGSEFFNDIKQHCLADMADVFNRFKSSNREVDQFIEKLKC